MSAVVRDPFSTLADRLVEVALHRFFASETQQEHDGIRRALDRRIREAYQELSPDQRRALEAVKPTGNDPVPRAPPGAPSAALAALFDRVGFAGLLMYVGDHSNLAVVGGGPVAQSVQVSRSLQVPDKQRRSLRRAGIRYSVGLTDNLDRRLLQDSLGQVLPGGRKPMAFIFDSRNLPQSLQDPNAQGQYRAAVDALLANLNVLPADQDFDTAEAAVIGMLLLDDQFDPTAPGFGGSVRQEWIELTQQSPQIPQNAGDPTTIVNRALYAALPPFIESAEGLQRGADITFQEFASVGRYVISHTDQVPWNHPNIPTQVRLGIDAFVSGATGFGGLDLPTLSGAGATDTTVDPDRIRAIGHTYAVYNYEQLPLFAVVYRIVEMFNNGLVPIGLGNAGKAIDAYYWSLRNRMTDADRHALYTRVLGATGGEIASDVPRNVDFQPIFMRFMSSIVEYDRQQRIDNLFTGANGRTRALTGETVRKNGLDLARNASLHCWAGGLFFPRRLNTDVADTVNIIQQPEVQQAFGVTNAQQVIERVAQTELGIQANVVKYKTMAESGKAILDLVAKYYTVWSSAAGNPLFPDLSQMAAQGGIAVIAAQSDVSLDDYLAFVRNAQYWMAVNGIKDAQVDQAIQPVESIASPSLPTLDGTAVVNAGNIDQIRQMVAQGKTPSLDDLQKLLPTKVGV